MLSHMLFSALLASATLLGSVSAAGTLQPSVGEIQNPGFEQGTPWSQDHSIVLPTNWVQGGSGSNANPTVVLSSDFPHTGTYSAKFLPQSVAPGQSGVGPESYYAEIYQEIPLVERGQLLTLTWWAYYGASADGATNGVYNFTVSYDHDHDSQVINAVQVPLTPKELRDNNQFFQYIATFNAPMAHDHHAAYITLAFSTYRSNVYVYLDDITLTAPLIVGDPQFVGLRGQSYQVHGIDGAVYNLVSSPSTQVNAEFKFLSEGECPVFDSIPDTNCWAHPGSYLGSVGVQEIVDGQLHQVSVISGSSSTGFASIIVDGQKIAVGSQVTDTDAFLVNRVSSHRVIVQTSQFMFTFDNSDMFINQAVATRVPMSTLQSHGLFGQTHQRKIYSSMLKYIVGDVDDYMIEEGTLFGKSFVYNQFQHVFARMRPCVVAAFAVSTSIVSHLIGL